MEKKIIWVLADDRPGNYCQAIGLAQKLADILGFEVKIKKIIYNKLAKLPNFLKIDGFLGLQNDSKNLLLRQTNPPQIIISAGRKSAPILSFLKSHYQAFAIQIMHPNWPIKFFDQVILPYHDRALKDENIIRITGSLGQIDAQILCKEYGKFAHHFDQIKVPKIALLVGGSSKKGDFSPKIAQNLGQMVSKVTKNMGAHLVVLNSRRTGEKITQILDDNLQCDKEFFKWQADKNWPNPYFAALQAADFIIATGDSISMCAEICSLKKPVYIFNPQEICSKKHLQFHQNLFDKKYAQVFDGKVLSLENFSTKKLDETTRIAQKISKFF